METAVERCIALIAASPNVSARSRRRLLSQFEKGDMMRSEGITRARTAAAIAALLLGGSLALAGCATSAEEGAQTETTSSAEPTAVATTTAPTAPSPTAEPSEPAPTQAPSSDDPAAWVVSGAGVGPLVLGQDFATLAGDLASGWTIGCGAGAPAPEAAVISYSGSDALSIFAAAGFDQSGAPNTALSQVSFTGTAGASPATAEGIGIGSTLAEAQAAYPDAQSTMLSNYAAALRVPAAGGTMYFGADNNETITGVTVTVLERPMSEFCG